MTAGIATGVYPNNAQYDKLDQISRDLSVNVAHLQDQLAIKSRAFIRYTACTNSLFSLDALTALVGTALVSFPDLQYSAVHVPYQGLGTRLELSKL